MAAGEPVPGKSMLRSRAVGIGSSAPDTVLPNTDLEELVDTSDEWIATRTGIRRRHLLKEVRLSAKLVVHDTKPCRLNGRVPMLGAAVTLP